MLPALTPRWPAGSALLRVRNLPSPLPTQYDGTLQFRQVWTASSIQ